VKVSGGVQWLPVRFTAEVNKAVSIKRVKKSVLEVKSFSADTKLLV
jgi:hypothetical protein